MSAEFPASSCHGSLHPILELDYESFVGLYRDVDCGSSRITVCLDELVRRPPGPEDLVGDAQLWSDIDVDTGLAADEDKIWSRLSEISVSGSQMLDDLCQAGWMRGSDGLHDGMSVVKCTAAALAISHPISDSDTSYIHIYIDGSAQCIDDNNVMSWGIACFRVDSSFNHDLFFTTGGVINTDASAPDYLGADGHNSYVAEV